MSNNNVSDGPIPFFTSGDNQSTFLSEANLVNNTNNTIQNQTVKQSQSIQQQNSTTTNPSKQSIQDVSSLFGNNNEDSFLSNINTKETLIDNTNATSNNTTNVNANKSKNLTQTLPNSSSLYYNQANNSSTTSLRSLNNQPYNSYIQNSDSNPQSINSSYTNLTSINQTNNSNPTSYMNSKIIPNKSPYISSPEPNAATGTQPNSYTQGFYSNIANQNSSSNLSNYVTNYAANNGSNSSINSFPNPHKTQTYPLPSCSNYQNSYQTYNNNGNSYLSPTSTTNSTSTTPIMANTSLNTSSYGTTNTISNTVQTTTTTGYSNIPTSAATTTGYANTQTSTTAPATSYMNTQTSTSTSSTGYSNLQTGITSTATTTYPNTQSNTISLTNTYSSQVSNTVSKSSYSTPIPVNTTTTYPMTTGYQNSTTNPTTGTYSAQATTINSTYSVYTQNTTANKNDNLLNPSASYSSLNTSTYNNNASATITNLKQTDTTLNQSANKSSGITNFTNSSSPQLNYYTSSVTNNVNTPSINSNASASSINDLQVESGVYPSSNSVSINNSFVNSNSSLNDIPTTTITTTTTNTSAGSSNINTPAFSSLYNQSKNSQNFYSNVATSNSSPCLNSMNTAYSTNNNNTVRKNSFDASGKHVKANSAVSPSSTYQNSLYSASNNADNASYNGSVNGKNEVPGSSLYYHEDNNGKFRSPTAPPSSNNASKLSPSSTNTNANRPPSVPPNYGSYNNGSNIATHTTNWNSNTPSINYSSFTTPASSTYTSTTYPTSTTSTPYQPDTTVNSTYRPTSTTPNPYQPDTTVNSTYRPTSTTPNPYQPDTTNGTYRPTSTTPNPYQPDAIGTYRPTSTTPNPYQSDTTHYYGGTDTSNNNKNFYNFDNQSQGEIHSCDPIVMHKNLSPIVTFGFGGKLIVMFPKDLSGYGGNTIGPNVVHVKPISNLIYSHVIEASKEHEGPILGLKKNKKQIIEMITKKINKIKSKDNHYSSYSSIDATDSDEVLILKTIQLYIENDGVLYGQNSKPEAIRSLRNLLLTSDSTSMNITHTVINGPSINTSEIENIKTCLLQGDRPGACKIAVNNKLWAHALIIASYINKETYKDVVNSFIKSELQGENENQRSSFQSIKVLYGLFAGMGKDAISGVLPPSSTMSNVITTQPVSTISAIPTIQSSISTPSTTNTSDIIGRWKEILGMILSNRTPNDVIAIVSLGDTLLSSGKLFSAHLCYLFSPSSISGLGNKNTKAVILGANHLKNKKFYQDLSAFQITEFLEYMYYLANKNLNTMPHFQAYKLAYASWLSDIGLVTKALSYAQCIMQIVKSGTSNNSNGSTTTSLYYNSTFCESLKEFSSRCQGHLSGTKNAPKDGWFSKITKFDSFLEAFDHGLNKFIGTTEIENTPNLNNTASKTSSLQPQVPNPVAMMPASTVNNVSTTSNLGMMNSSSYQSLDQSYYKTSYSSDNLNNYGSRKNSLSKSEQKGVFSLIGNLFNKNGGAISNNSSTTSLNQDESNKNGYYDSITKQWVTTNPQSNDSFSNEITAPPPIASDSYYNSGFNNSNGMINSSSTIGTLSNGVIPKFGTVGTTNGVNNSRRTNRTKYNDPLGMTYSNTTTTQANPNNPTVPPPLYSNNTAEQNNNTYNTYSWNNY